MSKVPPLRYLTILFCDLCSSVELAADMDCLDYVRVLRDLRALFRSSVAAHGGSIARLQGDGMLAIFEADGNGDAGYRAACCALELHVSVRTNLAQKVRDTMFPVLHSGIDAGPTYLEQGDVERGRFDLIGNAPNLAARLCGLAGRDDIYATERALTPCLTRLDVGARLNLVVRGWPDPLVAYAVQGKAEQLRRAPNRNPFDFVGQTREECTMGLATARRMSFPQCPQFT